MSPQLLPLCVLVGPTGVGKTEVAIELARRLDGEVVTADSMQVYRGMDIGTAKPTIAERAGIPHHLIDVITPDSPFNVARYRDLAHEAIAHIHARGRLPILSGGTGLYVKAVVGEFLFPDQGADSELRRKLQQEAETEGRERLHAKLAAADPVAAMRIHPNDVRRVVRALEVYESTGRTMTEHIAAAQARGPRYRDVRIGLVRDRAELYERIDRRVYAQLEQGLIDEVSRLRTEYRLHRTALQGLGYKEVLDYLDGRVSLAEAVASLQRETRHYAKRQLTWFRRDSDIVWFNLSESDSLSQPLAQMEHHIRTQLALGSFENT